MRKLIKSALFLGAGGVSMSRLARAYLDMGIKVYAYDKVKSNNLINLSKMRAKITTRFNSAFLHVDICVVSAAIPQNNPYLLKLKENKIPIIDRAEALGDLFKYFHTVIAVAGTHGKSTTASLIYHILNESGESVSCHIGANVPNERFRLGDRYLVVEACEYNRSFLHLHPDVAVVTNVECDHMDTYHNMFELQSSFTKFIKSAKTRYVYRCSSTKFLSRIKNIKQVEIKSNVESSLPGLYNQQNIALAKSVCLDLGVGEIDIDKAIKTFNGLPNRNERVGKYYNADVYIDYAHHPTEIECFVGSFIDKNSLIVFQPHTYSRTKYLFDEFVRVLSGIENIIIFKEYPAREKRGQGVSAYELFKAVRRINPNAKYAKTKQKLCQLLIKSNKIAFVGAGDISSIAKNILTN